MERNKNTKYQELNAISNIFDCKNTFGRFIELIESGKGDDVVNEMLTWYIDEFRMCDYKHIIDNDKKYGEKIVYDNLDYIITTNNSIIILYKRLEYKKFNLKKAENGNDVRTIKGNSVRIICFDAKIDDYPIIALVKEYGREILMKYNKMGEICNAHEAYNLVMV